MVLIVSLLLGTPVLSLLGAIGAALTLGLRAANVLVPLLVLPLTVPVLIFGAGAVDAAASGLSATPHLSLLGLQYDLAGDSLLVLIASLLIGTPVLSLVGAIGAALTLGLRAANVLVPLLVLPLTVPVLIFGAGAVDAAAAGLSVAPHLSLLAALLVVALFFAPWAAAAAVRIALE